MHDGQSKLIYCERFNSHQRPYQGRSRKEIRDQILARQVQIKRQEIPHGWSLHAADFINKVGKFSALFLTILVNPTKANKQIRIKRAKGSEKPSLA